MKIIQPIGNFHLSSSSQKLIIIKQQASHLRNYPSFQYHPSILVTSTGNNLYGSTVERILTANACFSVFHFLFLSFSLSCTLHTRLFVYIVEHADGMHMIYMYIYTMLRQGQKVKNPKKHSILVFKVIEGTSHAFSMSSLLSRSHLPSRTIAFALSIFCTNIDETIYWAMSTHALTK